MPGTALGLATVFGHSALEATYGTPSAINRRLEVVSTSIGRQNTLLQSEGISGNLSFMRLGSRRVISARQASGDTVHELNKQGLGRILNCMLGGTSIIAQQGGTTAWLQTHTFGTLVGKQLTLQRSLRDGAGTEIESFTHHGCKVASWELSVTVGSIPRLTVTWDCEDEDTSTATTALLALAEPTGGNFTFANAALTLNAVAAARLLEVTISGDNSLKTDSYFLGSGGLKAEPEVTAFRNITGSIRAEFTDPVVVYNRFTADTGIPMVLTFTGNVISGAFNELFTLTLPQIHFTGETPTVSGPDLIEQPAPFEASLPAGGALPTITYQTTDVVI